VDREDVAVVQTPQGFRVGVLRAAHRDVAGEATDDASLVERHGGIVVTVPGDPANLKVTFAEDLRIAEALR
jgi:2-C-methyl-D-erythritol 4-phosphate cytidylyltransferase